MTGLRLGARTPRAFYSAAKEMYQELGKALRARYGNKRTFRVVEDGDTKGFQSGKGKQAKIQEHIEPWELPPKSPGWMPLDFCLWDDIEDRVLANSNKKETQDEYTVRSQAAPYGLMYVVVCDRQLPWQSEVEHR